MRVAMDDLDFAILREMWRDRAMSAEGLDPRLSAEAIARKLRVGRTTVRARFKAWQRQGFLLGYIVVPNPALFGVSGAGQNVRIDDPRAKPKVLESLGLVDGVMVVFDYVGPWVAVSYAVESESALARRVKLVEHLPGVSATEPPIRLRKPPATMDPSPLDWRILAALHEKPTATLKELAASLDISLKTMVRRYQALVRANAVWFHADLDYAKCGGVLTRFILTLDSTASRTDIVEALRARYPRLIESVVPFDPPPEFTTRFAEVVVHFDAVGETEEATRVALGLPGVRDAEVLYPLRIRLLGSWFDEQIAGRVNATKRRPGERG